MIRNLLLAILCLHAFEGVHSQNKTEDPSKYDAYKNFVGQILTNNSTGLTPSFTFTASDKPALEASLPVYPFAGSFWTREAKRPFKLVEDSSRLVRNNFFLFANGKIASTDGVDALFSEGKWKPDGYAGLSGTIILKRVVRFYTSEIKGKDISTLPITQASSLYFFWLNAGAGYRQSTYSLYDTTRGLADAAFDTIVRGAYASASLNLYFFPSKNKTPWFTGYAKVGLDFLQSNTNNDYLKDRKGSYITSTVDSSNGVIRGIVQKETKFSSKDAASFKQDNSLMLPIELLFLAHSLDQRFYMGVGFVLNQGIIGNNRPTDVGLSLNLPLTKGKDDPTTVANFQLKFIWQDATNRNKPAGTETKDYRKERFKIGFTASAPLLISHRRGTPK